MGYYSEVALCFPQKANTEFLVAISNQTPEIQSEINDLISNSEKYTRDKAFLYHWSWVKWYSSFPCVGFIEKFLETIDNADETDLEYRLVRVGEEVGDIVEEGDYYDNPFSACSTQGVSFDFTCSYIETKENK